jgi:hypothetical protein
MVSLTQHTVRAHSIILALSKKIEPSWRLFKGKEAHQSIYCRQRKQARAVLSNLQAATPGCNAFCRHRENRTIPGGPNGSNISISIVRPQGSNETLLPVVQCTSMAADGCLAVLILMKGWLECLPTKRMWLLYLSTILHSLSSS